MTVIIVSDTTSLIVLEKLQALPLLCGLFSKVLVPQVVFAELCAGSAQANALLQDCPCLQVVEVPDSQRLSSLLLMLDQGEANAIELAATSHLPLIIDERKGRIVAQQLGIRITGFAGLLIQAVRNQLIDRQQANELLDQAVANGLHLAPHLQQQVKEVIKNQS